MKHLIREEIEKGMPNVFNSPKEAGVVEAIFIRPVRNERKSLQEVQLSPENGVEGDRWVNLCWVKLKDGSSDPRAQVSDCLWHSSLSATGAKTNIFGLLIYDFP